jgi:NitT/TauT family transport system substrate-binding protein
MAWDIGGAGVLPNIIGGPQDIETIGISNDESATNAMAGTASGVAAWPPTNIANATIALTANSTVHYVVEACLAMEEYDLMDANFSYGPPTNVLKSGEQYLGLWAPNLYLFLESNEGSDIICSGKDAGATVPGGIMVRKAFGEENGEIVAKVLAAWLRGIEFIKDEANRAKVLQYMKEFYDIYNVTISDAAMEEEIALRPIFTLEEQLVMMDRSDGPSIVDRWFSGVSAFMFNAGVLAEDPAPETFITDTYMQMVKDDDQLRLFALRENATNTDPTSAATSTRSMWMLASMTGTILVATSFV